MVELPGSVDIQTFADRSRGFGRVQVDGAVRPHSVVVPQVFVQDLTELVAIPISVIGTFLGMRLKKGGFPLSRE